MFNTTLHDLNFNYFHASFHQKSLCNESLVYVQEVETLYESAQIYMQINLIKSHFICDLAARTIDRVMFVLHIFTLPRAHNFLMPFTASYSSSLNAELVNTFSTRLTSTKIMSCVDLILTHSRLSWFAWINDGQNERERERT